MYIKKAQINRTLDWSMEQEIRFKYKFQENYNPVYTNGVYGGFNVSGDLVANFFFERLPIPKEEIVGMYSGQPIEANVPSIPVTIIRYIQTGIVINLDTAKVIRDWLDTQIKNAEAQIV